MPSAPSFRTSTRIGSCGSVSTSVAFCKAIREAVGDRSDLLFGTHGQFTTAGAIRLGQALEPYAPLWFEEPVPPESWKALKQVKEQVRTRICVGERLHTRWEFVPIFEHGLADFVMPDVTWTGGISELKKIATMAEENEWRRRTVAGLEAEVNPIVIRRARRRLVWGDLHGHSGVSDGTGTPEDYYAYARDVARLDVAVLTDHDHWGVRPLDADPTAQEAFWRERTGTARGRLRCHRWNDQAAATSCAGASAATA